MSEKTEKRIRELENNYGIVNQKLDNICKKLDSIPTKEELRAVNAEQEIRIKADIKDEYATKDRVQRIEKLLWFLLGGAFASVMGYLFTEFTHLL
jgi:hypothetical protein